MGIGRVIILQRISVRTKLHDICKALKTATHKLSKHQDLLKCPHKDWHSVLGPKVVIKPNVDQMKRLVSRYFISMDRDVRKIKMKFEQYIEKGVGLLCLSIQLFLNLPFILLCFS